MTDGPGEPTANGAQRLDKWLWFARVTKSRSLAAACIEAGEVKVNRVRVEKASQTVKVGDVITSRVSQKDPRSQNPGPRHAPRARKRGSELYEDLTPKPEPRAAVDPAIPLAQAIREPGAGRPTKRDRRLLTKLTGRG